ncbi:MAG: hypothetical protein QOI62_1304 [Solirubrobacteraceae bacterium]|nr:hypothetical protein [Solirubrobacteraceae bacterium]
MTPRRVLATLGAPALADPARLGVDGLAVRLLEPGAEPCARRVGRVVRAAARHDAILLDGSERCDQAAAALLGLRRSSPPLVLAECVWKRGSSPLDALANRAGVRAIDRGAVTYCVLSRTELELLPRVWGVSPARVAFTPYHYRLTAEDLREPCPPGTGVFAGGDSMRDYGPLIAAAAQVDVPVTITTVRPDVAGHRALPPNLVATGRVPHARFIDLLRGAAIVVVGLEPGIQRSAGQQTYLNAMALGKATVVTDSPGVRDYVEDGRTGLIVPPGDAQALAQALRWLKDPANRAEVDALRARARDVARTVFTPERYAASVLAVVQRALVAR